MAKAKVVTESNMMRVEILSSVAGNGFSYKKGDVVELDIAMAEDFIRAGYAKEVK